MIRVNDVRRGRRGGMGTYFDTVLIPLHGVELVAVELVGTR